MPAYQSRNQITMHQFITPTILFAAVTSYSHAAQTVQNHSSSNWWSRLIESSGSMPVNRRSHSATVYRTTSANDDTTVKEYMIVSGGFTDQDWQTFPVWSYDMTDARSVDDDDESKSEFNSDSGDDSTEETTTAPWMDLTGINLGGIDTPDDLNEFLIEKNGTAASFGPQGRVGHLSSIYKDCLYIFGGLTYSLGSFHVENDKGDDDGDNDNNNQEKNTMIVWRACGLSDLFVGGEESRHRKLDENNERALQWERIVPRVDTTIPSQPDVDELHKEDDNAAAAAAAATLTEPPTDDVAALVQELMQEPEPVMLSRGETQGGHYSPTDDSKTKECFIIYGGMHRHHTAVLENGANAPSANNEVPLGDIWKYDYETETLSLLAPYPPLDWQRDKTTTKTFPTARTSHAGAIVGNKLIIHGGMGSYGDELNTEEDIADHQTSSYSSSSYATYKTSPRWMPLSDTWEFDLIRLKWKERIQYPQLARSYHSLVGWPDGRIAAFGGFQQDNNIGGETVAFVFKDVIVNRPNETHWMKLQSPYSQIANWRKYHYTPKMGISNRLEHTAVLDQFGSMYVWGGRFQSVHQISGMWRLDLFNSDANLEYELAQPDGIEEQYEAELEALHMFILMMMFVSLTLSSFFSIMQQGRAREAAEEGNRGSIVPRRGGLTRLMIDSLPLKHYDIAETAGSVDSSNNSSLEESECCPICLVQYEQGSEIRSLPCGHDFCRACVDQWLCEHTSCPSCRTRVESIAVRNGESSWVASIARMYTPNRRNPRNFFEGPQSFDRVETESTDPGASTQLEVQSTTNDDWYEQDPPVVRSWLRSLRSGVTRTRDASHAVIPIAEDDDEGVEFV